MNHGELAPKSQEQEVALPEPASKKPKLSKEGTPVVKEINADHIVRTQRHLGSGSYGSCFLAFYRGMTVVVKELKPINSKHESKEEAQKRTRNELMNEANIINKLGDHPGVPLLYGVCSKSHPFQLVMQFHGGGCVSLTILKALYSKAITKKLEWDTIIMKSGEALEHIHGVGFLHNDLKSNNIILDKRGNVHIPVIIDFGKSRIIANAKGPKKLSSEAQKVYKRNYPHVAHEIVEGRGGQSLSSDIFSFGKIIQQIYDRCKFGEIPELVKRCVSQ